MKQTILLSLGLFFSSWGGAQALSPEVVAASGSHFTGANAQLSWTLGETVIETWFNGTSQITQGFNQTNLIITAIEDLAQSIQLQVFPNPTSDRLNIEWQESTQMGFALKLFDANGRLYWSNEPSSGNTQATVDLSTYTPGTYYLYLNNQGGNAIKTFKIIKIK